MSRVSVIMSVHNGERYVRDSVNSILKQTFEDFEFIIIDDASEDDSWKVLKEFGDGRIHLLKNETNIGLTKSLNRGIGLAVGEYIARQDADDLSLPARLAKQVSVLNDLKRTDVVTSWYGIIDRTGTLLEERRIPTEEKRLYKIMKRWNPVCHGSVMVRRKSLTDVGLYREDFRYAQDYDLWLRMIGTNSCFHVIPEVLYYLRLHPQTLTVKDRISQERYKKSAGNQITAGRPFEVSPSGKVRPDLHKRKNEAVYLTKTSVAFLRGGDKVSARARLFESIKTYGFLPKSWMVLGMTCLPTWMNRWIFRFRSR